MILGLDAEFVEYRKCWRGLVVSFCWCCGGLFDCQARKGCQAKQSVYVGQISTAWLHSPKARHHLTTTRHPIQSCYSGLSQHCLDIRLKLYSSREQRLIQRPPCGAIAPTCKSFIMTCSSRYLTACSYISYRQSYAHHPAKKTRFASASGNGYSNPVGSGSEERQGLMSAGAFEDDGDVVIEMDLLPPRWADISDEVTEYLANIAHKSVKLEKLHQKHVLPGFDDDEVKKSEEGEIEHLTQDITKGFHDCQKAIQRVEQIVRDSRHSGGISKGEETMARNIQISLAGRVQEASAGFRKKQSAYLKSRLQSNLYIIALTVSRTSRIVWHEHSAGTCIHPIIQQL